MRRRRSSILASRSSISFQPREPATIRPRISPFHAAPATYSRARPSRASILNPMSKWSFFIRVDIIGRITSDSTRSEPNSWGHRRSAALRRRDCDSTIRCRFELAESGCGWDSFHDAPNDFFRQARERLHDLLDGVPLGQAAQNGAQRDARPPNDGLAPQMPGSVMMRLS